MSSAIKSKVTDIGNADKILSTLPFELRGKVLRDATRKGATVVAREARRLVPVGTDHKEGRRLRNTISTKTKQYGARVATFVGPRYGPGQGNHGHLIEFGGFRRVLWGKATQVEEVRPQPFMRPAADTTIEKQKSEVVNHLKAHIKTVGT